MPSYRDFGPFRIKLTFAPCGHAYTVTLTNPFGSVKPSGPFMEGWSRSDSERGALNDAEQELREYLSKMPAFLGMAVPA